MEKQVHRIPSQWLGEILAFVMTTIVLASLGAAGSPPSALATEASDLWSLAQTKQSVHRYSTLITASQVRDLLATDEGIDAAIDWCKKTGVTKVYLETLKDANLVTKLKAFIAAGKPTLITDGLAGRIDGRVAVDR